MKRYSSIEKYHLIEPLLEGEVTEKALSITHQVPCRTIRYWKKQYLDRGLSGLERKKRKGKGLHPNLSEELVQLIQALALQKPAWTITAIHKKVEEFAKRQHCKLPAYSTIYKIVKSIPPALVTLAHQGAKTYRQKYELIYRRECQRPNEIWQVDHSLLDIYLIDEQRRACKPWLTIVIDDFSRAICGYFLSFAAPCALHTALALRQAIWRKGDAAWPMCGIPQVLYTDHGVDFMSRHIQQVCINLKIRMINSMVARPQGRGKIERFFETVNQGVLQSLAGYCLKGKATSKPSLALQALQPLIENFIIEHYHHQVHTTTAETPYQRWTGNGFLPQLPDSLQQLDLLLLSVDKPRKVHRDGIRFQGLRYIAPTLAGFVGEPVTIRYDPRDLAQVRIYYQETFLCHAICQDIAELVVSLKQIQQARKQTKQQYYQQISEAKLMLKQMQQDKAKEQHKEKPISKTFNPLKRYEND